MPRPSSELWCISDELAPQLRRALDRRGLRVRRVVVLASGARASGVPAVARGCAVVAVVLETQPSIALLDAIAGAARAARAAAVVSVAGAGPSQAPVLRALTARRGLAFAADLDTLVEVAALLADSGVPRGGRVAVVARGPGAAREVVGAAARIGVTPAAPGRALGAVTTPQGPAAVMGRASAAAVRRALVADAQHDIVVWVGCRPARARATGGLVEIEASVIGGAVSTRTVIGGAARVARLLEAICAIGGRTPEPVGTPAAPGAGRRRLPFVPDRDATLAVLDGPPRALSDPSSKRALSPYRVPCVPEVLCTSATGAERAARQLRAPLVAKVASPDVPMGSDAPGVVTGILNAPQARAAYHTALRSVTGARSGPRVLGVRIAEDVSGLASLAVQLDRVDGAIVLRVGGHGPAGAVVEELALTLPAGREDLACLVDALPWRVLWSGAGGRPQGDRAALIDLLARACLFAEDLATRVSQVVLDPVIVRAKGQGAQAVDARVTVG